MTVDKRAIALKLVQQVAHLLDEEEQKALEIAAKPDATASEVEAARAVLSRCCSSNSRQLVMIAAVDAIDGKLHIAADFAAMAAEDDLRAQGKNATCAQSSRMPLPQTS